MRSLTDEVTVMCSLTHHVRHPAALQVDVQFTFCSDFLTLVLNRGEQLMKKRLGVVDQT